MMDNDTLARLIAKFGAEAMEARQVAKRLSSLLPARFAEVKRSYVKRNARGSAAAERLALTDARYLESIEEYARITGTAAAARVQYETHAMLYQARQSLRANHRFS